MARGSEQSGMVNSLLPGARSMSCRGSAVMAPPRSPIRSARRGGRGARVVGDFGDFVAQQVDRGAFQAVGHRAGPLSAQVAKPTSEPPSSATWGAAFGQAFWSEDQVFRMRKQVVTVA